MKIGSGSRKVAKNKSGNIKMKTLNNLIVLFFALMLFQNISLADGFIVIPRPHPLPNPFPLEVVYHKVDVNIDGQSAITKIDQSFYNPSGFQLEGIYIFPIPKGAVIHNFTMVINGKETKAELLDSDKARKIYEDIVRQMRDPTLLEYSEQNIFRMRIFPIEPKSEKKISISYSQVLEPDNNLYEYLYPLNTEKFSAKLLKNVAVKVTLKTLEKIKNIYSPTHQIDIVNKSDYNAVISYEAENIKPDIDFKLYFSLNPSAIGLTLLNYKSGQDGYFFLNASPSFHIDRGDIIAKDITFILDVSGSMSGDKLSQAKKALLYCVNNLGKEDHFNIIRFSTEAYPLFNSLKKAEEKNTLKAKKFINDLQAIGGTNIEEAFELAFKNLRGSGRPHYIIFLTDGKPTIGETHDDKLSDKIKKMNNNASRIFTFGIGEDINTHLLDKITEATKAWRTYVGEEEDIEIKVSSFYDKIQSPVLSNLKLTFSGNVEIYQSYPKELPDLFKGSNLILFGRYRGNGSIKVTLNGDINGERKEFTLNNKLTDNDKHDFIPPLWASRRIGYLLDVIRLNGENKELVDEIVSLAREHGIITPYTSYLILEDEEIRRRNNQLAEDIQILPPSQDLRRNMQSDYLRMHEKSGRGSVEVSNEFQELNSAQNFQQTKQGNQRLYYKDSDGAAKNLVQQVRNIQGRAFYQQSSFWVDSELQKQNTTGKKRIKFSSDEYFNLLKQEPAASQYLALGKNVRFFHKNIYYEIFE